METMDISCCLPGGLGFHVRRGGSEDRGLTRLCMHALRSHHKNFRVLTVWLGSVARFMTASHARLEAINSDFLKRLGAR